MVLKKNHGGWRRFLNHGEGQHECWMCDEQRIGLGGYLVIIKQTFQIPLTQNINAKLARAVAIYGAVAWDSVDVVLRDSGRRVT
jgi:hypothetical protein